jgi:hypothetical protein
MSASLYRSKNSSLVILIVSQCLLTYLTITRALERALYWSIYLSGTNYLHP